MCLPSTCTGGSELERQRDALKFELAARQPYFQADLYEETLGSKQGFGEGTAGGGAGAGRTPVGAGRFPALRGPAAAWGAAVVDVQADVDFHLEAPDNRLYAAHGDVALALGSPFFAPLRLRLGDSARGVVAFAVPESVLMPDFPWAQHLRLAVRLPEGRSGAGLGAGTYYVGLATLPLTVRPVQFRDPPLAAAVRAALRKSDGALTTADLRQLRHLEADGRGIAALAPLAQIRGLMRLDLSGNAVRDLAPLQNLRALTELWLSHNQAEDISPLRGLGSLRILGLRGNQIRDLEAFWPPGSLLELDLGENRITDLQPLVRASQSGALQRAHIRLDGNPLDLSAGALARQDIQALTTAGATVSH